MASKASRRAARAGRRAGTRQVRKQEKRRQSWLAPLLIGGAAIVALAVGWFALSGSGAEEVPAAEVGSDAVQVLSGNPHTVYHSLAPIPSTSVPQPDGIPTLVWFSGTWCEFCHAMEPFANATIAEFAGRMDFLEKSVDHARPDRQRFRVRGTPTFVLVDREGQEIGRFGFQRSADELRQAIEGLLPAGS